VNHTAFAFVMIIAAIMGRMSKRLLGSRFFFFLRLCFHVMTFLTDISVIAPLWNRDIDHWSCRSIQARGWGLVSNGIPNDRGWNTDRFFVHRDLKFVYKIIIDGPFF
jgi:hypothetical protein